MVHEYKLLHLISIYIADCIPLKNLLDSIDNVTEKLINEVYTIPTTNIDSVIFDYIIRHTN